MKQEYINKYFETHDNVSRKRIAKVQQYDALLQRFGEEMSYETFLELMSIKIEQFETYENKYRSKQAKKICAHLPEDEQGAEARKYIKRLYKWFDVTLTKEEVDAFYKLNIKNGDMRRRYIRYAKES